MTRTATVVKRLPHGAASDGRVRRSQRSGNAIVDALMELVGEGMIEPTAQQVAQRAKVGIRTVFRRFADMERLFAEMDARLQAEAVPLLIGGRPAGTLAQRARALVQQRVAFFERIAPYKRSGNLKRWRSSFLRERHALLVRTLRTELLRWLPELRRVPAATVDALELATSFEAWDRLRSEQRLSSQRAQTAVERTVMALVNEVRKENRRCLG
ncbi:MAG TPA: TetR/AcrR family transcriptional regulator [Candidatus Binatia bacterium]|nr:TetR/AcrR family transcriptional regulator [Candidatus Binatia bacterium]